jgi:molybdopterin synthase sulfur carrier subunit
MVKLLYFARLREDLGTSAEELVLPEEITTVAGLRAYLSTRGEPWRAGLSSNRSLRVAVNQELAQATTPIGADDEVAFFPPVTGG